MNGIDVSSNDGTVDWYALHQAGSVDFAWVKATEGFTYDDPTFRPNINGANRVGIAVGAYHFARPHSNTAQAEADHFLSIIGDTPLLAACLDFEDDKFTGGGADWALNWLQRVESRRGITPHLYTYTSYWRAHGSPDPAFLCYPLWIAAYQGYAPTLPAPWATWDIWQFTSSGRVAGINTNVDLNRAATFGEEQVQTKEVTVTADHKSGHGFADTGIPKSKVVAATVIAGNDGTVVSGGLLEQPAMDGNALVGVDLHTATLVDVPVNVLVAYTN